MLSDLLSESHHILHLECVDHRYVISSTSRSLTKFCLNPFLLLSISISRNHLSRSFVRQLVTGLAMNHNLRVLNLARNELSTRDFESIIEALGANRKLTTLE